MPGANTLENSRIRSGYVASTVMFAASRGLAIDEVFAATGLTSEDIVDPDRWVAAASVAALWNLLAARYPGEPLSLEMARVAPHRLFGPLAYGGQFAASLREALVVFTRYSEILSADLEVVLCEAGSEAALRVRHPVDAYDGGYSAELGMAVGVRMLREVLGIEDALVRVDFAYPSHGPVHAYTDFFGVDVRFCQPHMAYVLRPGALDLPPKHANRQLFAYIEHHAQALREQLAATREPPELLRVRAAIVENGERGDYTAQALAARLGVGLRSLQRTLRPHGQSVRGLLEQARETRAKQLLGDLQMSIDEVAFLLGYSAERALTRAFKRWTGETPAQFRRSRRAAV